MAFTEDSTPSSHKYFAESSVTAMPSSASHAVCSAMNSSRSPVIPFAAKRASRDRCFCSSISPSKPFMSTDIPASSAMSSVKSIGKPRVS